MEPEQEARLWELYYGLLSGEEAAELQNRIASDPQWAELWAQVQQKAGLVGEAARLQTDPLPLPSAQSADSAASGDTVSPEPTAYPPLLSESVRSVGAASRPKLFSKPASAKRADRWAVWVVYVSTGILLLVALWGALVHRHYLLALTGQHLRLVVQGPSVLRRGVENHFLVLTTRVDGRPVEAQVEWALFGPDQKRFFSQKETTDPQGQLRVVLPADMDLPPWVQVQVQAEAGSQRETHQLRLEVAPVEYQTFLGMDRLYYRPGEKLLFRCISVPRFRRLPQEQMWVEVELRDAEDRPVAGCSQEGRTWEGIGCGEFRIPPDMPAGLYVVVARNAQQRFPEVRKPFWILSPRESDVQVAVEFPQAPYHPGETVTAQIQLLQNGQPLPRVPLEIRAELGAQILHRDSLQTDGQGQCRIAFQLPERLAEQDAWLWVKLLASQPPLITCRPIPLDRSKIRCQFYPEAGLLVPEVENRVYFSIRDDQGRPVEVRGRLLDRQDRPITEVHTRHLGRGVFQFVPLKDQQYRFEILQPEGLAAPIELPPVAEAPKVLIKTSLAVVPPAQPLQFQIWTPPEVKTQVPLMVAVVCRGVLVAQQWLVPQIRQEGLPNETPVQIPLPQDLWGLLRLRVYDYSRSPPVLLAERLLYRLPPERLRVELGLPPEGARPGKSVTLRLSVQEGQGSLMSAIAGLSVVEESFLGTMPGLCPISPFWWLDELWEIPEDLEQAEQFLTDHLQSHQNLDLLLGTWGGRLRPVVGKDSVGQVAQPQAESGSGPLGVLAPEDAPPLVLDNLHRIQANYQQAKELFQQARPETLNAITLSSLLGGAGLVMFVILATLLQVAGGLRMWIPALVGAGICVAIGLVLAHPELLRPRSPYALPFAEYPACGHLEGSLAGGETGSGSAVDEQKSPQFGSSVPTGQMAPHFPKAAASRLPVHLEDGLTGPFGVPRSTLRRLLSIGLQEAQQLASPSSASQSGQQLSGGPAPPPTPKKPFPAEENRSAKPADSGPRPSVSSASKVTEALLQSNPSAAVPPPSAEPTYSETPMRNAQLPASPSGSRFVLREYAYRASRAAQTHTPLASQSRAAHQSHPVPLLYWHPFFVIGPERSAQCRFDLPEQPACFRIRADVLAPNGHMSLAETKLVSKPQPLKPPPSSEEPPAKREP